MKNKTKILFKRFKSLCTCKFKNWRVDEFKFQTTRCELVLLKNEKPLLQYNLCKQTEMSLNEIKANMLSIFGMNGSKVFFIRIITNSSFTMSL